MIFVPFESLLTQFKRQMEHLQWTNLIRIYRKMANSNRIPHGETKMNALGPLLDACKPRKNVVEAVQSASSSTMWFLKDVLNKTTIFGLCTDSQMRSLRSRERKWDACHGQEWSRYTKITFLPPGSEREDSSLPPWTWKMGLPVIYRYRDLHDSGAIRQPRIS